jgi:hypothetical protein
VEHLRAAITGLCDLLHNIDAFRPSGPDIRCHVIGILATGGGETNISYLLSFVITLISSVSYIAIILPVTATAYQYFNIMERKYAPGLSRDIENLKTAD